MSKKENYKTPIVLSRISFQTEGGILAGSVVEQVSDVNTIGQEKGDFFEDASSTGSSTFNHTWGE